MHSSLPKVLHPVCGVPMLQWVIEAAQQAGADRVVCITRPDSGVAEALPPGAEAAEQTEGEGTGSAVLTARAAIEGSDRVLILSGDVPLTATETIEALIREHESQDAAATLLTTDKLDPDAYGRILRGEDGLVEGIVETKSTEGVSEDVLKIRCSRPSTRCRSSRTASATSRTSSRSCARTARRSPPLARTTPSARWA
jgi:bifunctional UDP-N-acetylglucosamine pyrophosphorylase/glucosamine-1-phosphate N-acetyltransferase